MVRNLSSFGSERRLERSLARNDLREGVLSATAGIKRNPPIGLWNFRSPIIASFCLRSPKTGVELPDYLQLSPLLEPSLLETSFGHS